MKKAKVLYVSQEITPYLDKTEIASIGRHLPQGIQERGKEIRTFMPRFGLVNERRNQLHEVIRLSGMNLIIDDSDHPLIIKVASIQAARMQVYFIDNEEYFHRKCFFHDEDGNFFSDNDERMVFFCRGVIETVKKLGWAPDIIHCNGWMTSLLPLFVKKVYFEDPMFAESKIVYSVYNDDYKVPMSRQLPKKIMMEGLTEEDLEPYKNPTYMNLTKAAIDQSDAVIYGSERVHPDLPSYLTNCDKPVLNYQNPDDYIGSYDEFYEEVVLGEVEPVMAE